MNTKQPLHCSGMSWHKFWISIRETFGLTIPAARGAAAALMAFAFLAPDARAQMVPFAVQANGGLCDSGASGTSNPQIIIDGTGTNLFVVTSILIKTGPQPQNREGYTFVTVNSVVIDGTRFDTSTGNLFAPVSGWGVDESADIMGMPVRITTPSSLTASPRTASPPGGNFPHQIVADSSGSTDIRITLFCRADAFDLSLATIRVSGWKAPGDTVAVTYIPGH